HLSNPARNSRAFDSDKSISYPTPSIPNEPVSTAADTPSTSSITVTTTLRATRHAPPPLTKPCPTQPPTRHSSSTRTLDHAGNRRPGIRGHQCSVSILPRPSTRTGDRVSAGPSHRLRHPGADGSPGRRPNRLAPGRTRPLRAAA